MTTSDFFLIPLTNRFDVPHSYDVFESVEKERKYLQYMPLKRRAKSCFLLPLRFQLSLHSGEEGTLLFPLPSAQCGGARRRVSPRFSFKSTVRHSRVCGAGMQNTHCDTLEHAATHCNTLQHTATQKCAAVCCSVLQCVPVFKLAVLCRQ